MLASYLEWTIVVCLLLIPIVYEFSHTFRYHLKFIIFYSVVIMSCVVLIPVMLFRPFDCRNLLWMSSLCRHITTVLGLKWELRGKDNLEKKCASIIISNHQSALDILGMFNIWHVMEKCTVVAKKELFYAWPIGLTGWLCGLIFIDRSRSQNARDVLTFATEEIKRNKAKLWLFPEGTRKNTEEIHTFKKGAFHMAVEGQIPILPVVFSSYATFLNDEKRVLEPGQIIVTALPAIPTKGMTVDDIPRLMEEVHNQMSEEYKKSSKEISLRSKFVNPVNLPNATANAGGSTTDEKAGSSSKNKKS